MYSRHVEANQLVQHWFFIFFVLFFRRYDSPSPPPSRVRRVAPPRSPEIGGPRHRRGDEWADPWMRGQGGNEGGRRASRKRSYSSGSSRYFFVDFDKNFDRERANPLHIVLERIWVKGSYLSQWLPQGEKGPPKESQSLWIEILHIGSQFTLWFLKIKNFQKFSDHSEFFFCPTIHKKLNKSCFLEKNFLFLKKNFFSLKKNLKKNFVSGTHRGRFQFIVILTP